MRFSVLTLLGMVAYAAVACFAMLHPNMIVAATTTAVFLALLAAAPILAIYSLPGRGKAFWIALAIVAWTLEYAVYYVQGGGQLTSLASEYLFPYVEAVQGEITPAEEYLYRNELAESYFETICYHSFAIPFSIAGGLLGQHLYSHRQKQNAQAAERSYRAG